MNKSKCTKCGEGFNKLYGILFTKDGQKLCGVCQLEQLFKKEYDSLGRKLTHQEEHAIRLSFCGIK